MSKLRKVSDYERTSIMLDLLHGKFGFSGALEHMPPQHVVIEEVADGTGFARRWADVLVLNCWRSGRFELDGFEVKASRADLKRELATPSKHQAVARFCDRWTLVAWDEKMLEGLEIPTSWGVVVTRDINGVRELHQVRRAPKLSPEPFTRGFVASMVRNAHQQAPGAALLSRTVVSTVDRVREEFRRQQKAEAKRAVEPLARALYGEDQWRWPAEAQDPAAVIAAAVGRLNAPFLPPAEVAAHG